MLSTMSMCLSRSSQANGLGARKPELSFPTSENDSRLAAGLASIDAMCLTDLVEPKRCGRLRLVPAATPSMRHRVMRSSRTTSDISFVICRRRLHAATQVHLAVIDAKCRDRDHQTTDLRHRFGI